MNTINYKKIVFILFIISFFISPVFSQDNDFRAWSEIEYNLDIDERISITFSQHFRLKKDLNTVDSYITESEIIYSPLKKIKLLGQLRYHYKNENSGGLEGFENLYRYRFGIEKKFNTNYFNIDLRVAYQNRVSLDRKDRFKKRLRIRPSFEIIIKDWNNKPKLFYEYFDEIKGKDQKAHRYGISLKKNLIKNQSFTFRYFFQQYNEASNLDYNNNVISLKYSFN
tara:strand:- start:433 stop:1107 length:675 start_codon:yes stop_codon:yes gene_type:complete